MESIQMNDGHAIPQVGYGVFMMSPAEVDTCLPQAIEAGYRHIDTANAYFNERAVGRQVRASGIPREEFFITTKLFPQSYPADQCAADIDATLARLGMDYVDLLLLHQPYGEYVQAWKALEEAVAQGKVRSIGLSNFPMHKIKEILDIATIRPAALQIEINPYWNQHKIKGQLADLDIAFEAWYPLGHGDRKLLEEPVFARLAEKYGKTASQVILRWHVQEGNIVFPKTLSRAHMEENLDIFDFELTADEMTQVNSLPQKPYYAVPEEAPDFVLVRNDYDSQE